jgi:hypothetical protein
MLENAEGVQNKIEQLECRWITGDGGQLPPDLLPLQWQPVLEHLENEQQTLYALALYSQHEAMLFEPEAATNLVAKPDLPDLALPCLPPGIRPCFRRVLEAIKPYPEITITQVLQLLQQRGFSAHPADWLPTSQDGDLPPMYHPWCNWIFSNKSSELTLQLTSQTWDDLYPADRLRLLQSLRMKDPRAARDLIQAHASKESAEKRLKIIQLLAINLSEEDSSLLESLTTNRSQKVALLAKQYLARLGAGQQEMSDEECSEQAQDLTETFELKKTGLLKKGYKLFPVKLKSKKQQAVRSELLNKVPLPAFAQALDIELHVLLTSWQFSNNRDHDNQSFVANAVNTLPDALFPVLLENILNQLAKDQSLLSLIPFFLPRMQAQDREQLMKDFLAMKGLNFSFSDCLAYIDQPLSALDWKKVVTTHAWKMVIKELGGEGKEKFYIDNHGLASELIALGVFLPHSLAAQVVESLVAAGVQPADPALESLKLNMQLAPPVNHESKESQG